MNFMLSYSGSTDKKQQLSTQPDCLGCLLQVFTFIVCNSQLPYETVFARSFSVTNPVNSVYNTLIGSMNAKYEWLGQFTVSFMTQVFFV